MRDIDKVYTIWHDEIAGLFVVPEWYGIELQIKTDELNEAELYSEKYDEIYREIGLMLKNNHATLVENMCLKFTNPTITRGFR